MTLQDRAIDAYNERLKPTALGPEQISTEMLSFYSDWCHRMGIKKPPQVKVVSDAILATGGASKTRYSITFDVDGIEFTCERIPPSNDTRVFLVGQPKRTVSSLDELGRHLTELTRHAARNN